MTGKPSSLRAAVIAAAHCTHPELDGVDSGLLQYLAAYAGKESGANSHPGNRNIADALKLGDSATDSRIRKNIERGLLERTSKADGRGRASVYRLRFECVHFPDQAPGGEWLIEKPPGAERADSETARPTNENRPVEMIKPPGASNETARSESGNRPVEDAKPPGLDQPPTRAQQMLNEKITIPPSNSQQPAPPQIGGDVNPEGGKDGDPFGADEETPTPMAAEMERLKKALYDEKNFYELKGMSLNCAEEQLYSTWLQENPGEVDVLLGALRMQIDNREEHKKGIEGKYKDKWGTLLKEAEEHGFIEDARAEVKRQKDNEATWHRIWQRIRSHERKQEFRNWLWRNDKPDFKTMHESGGAKAFAYTDTSSVYAAERVETAFDKWLGIQAAEQRIEVAQ